MKRFIFAILFIVLLISSGFGLSFSGFDSKDSDIVVSGDSFCYMVRYLGDYNVYDSCSYVADNVSSVGNLSIHRGDDCWVLSSGSMSCSGSVEKDFVLEGGKVWVFKIVLYEPAKLLNFLRVHYILKTTRSVVGHRHSVTSITLLNESMGLIFATATAGIFIPSYSHPLFYHLNNHTVDNLKMVLEKNSILNLFVEDDILIPSIFDEGVYYIVVGSQAYTLNSSDYDVFYNVSFVFPENYSMSIEVYKQNDPIGVSFSEMNASYIYCNFYDTLFGNGGKTVFINGNVVIKPNHTLLIGTVFPPYPLSGVGVGWYDFTIGSDRYIGFGWYNIIMRNTFYLPPWIMVYNSRSLHLKLSYGSIGWRFPPVPTSISAFDIELK